MLFVFSAKPILEIIPVNYSELSKDIEMFSGIRIIMKVALMMMMMMMMMMVMVI